MMIISKVHSLLAILMIQMPSPGDIELPLPLAESDLKLFLVILFLAHILFVNLMVGGSLLAVIFEIIGLSNPKYDALGKSVSRTITVNKSLAVVLGVGPLLCISLAYTIHFYSANALTGYGWIAVVPLVTLAFLLAYVHKYSWDRWTGDDKRAHIMVGIGAALLFLCVPFIFLTNINLMLFPADWVNVKGFFSSLRVGNVFPRFFHFLTASLAITGLFLAWWFGRKKFPVEELLPGFTRSSLRRLFYRMVFYLTLAQLIFGPMLLFTLPAEGITTVMLVVILSGVAVVIALLVALSREIDADDTSIGKSFVLVAVLLTTVVLAMGTGRHLYREGALAYHKTIVTNQTDTFHSIVVATQMRLAAGLGAGDALATGPTGESVFRNCAACHAVDKVLAAPPLTDIYSIYKGDPQGIVAWAKAPGKKRPEFTQMPSFAHLGDEQLELVAEYMLQKGSGASQTTSGADSGS